MMFSLPRTSASLNRLNIQRTFTAFKPSPRVTLLNLSYTISQNSRGFAKVAMNPAQKALKDNYAMDNTSGYQQPVWISTEPYSNRPSFPKLDRNISSDVVIVGAGITGISAAYECVKRGISTTLIDAREVLSGETGRTSGHLSSALDDHYYELIKSRYIPRQLVVEMPILMTYLSIRRGGCKEGV